MIGGLLPKVLKTKHGLLDVGEGGPTVAKPTIVGQLAGCDLTCDNLHLRRHAQDTGGVASYGPDTATG